MYLADGCRSVQTCSAMPDSPVCYLDTRNASASSAEIFASLDVCETIAGIENNVADIQLRMFYQQDAWVLQLPGEKTRVTIDFASGEFTRRLLAPNIMAEAVVRAVRGRAPADAVVRVFDATAGAGRDAMLLAAAGCEVMLCERLPLLAELLAVALSNAQHDPLPELSAAASRCQLLRGVVDSAQLMADWPHAPPEVIYLDPLYQHSQASGKQGLKSSALSNKLMRVLQHIDALYAPRMPKPDPVELMEAALRLAKHKVIVKRPPAAPPLAGLKPASQLSTKTVRFDVYPR